MAPVWFLGSLLMWRALASIFDMRESAARNALSPAVDIRVDGTTSANFTDWLIDYIVLLHWRWRWTRHAFVVWRLSTLDGSCVTFHGNWRANRQKWYTSVRHSVLLHTERRLSVFCLFCQHDRLRWSTVILPWWYAVGFAFLFLQQFACEKCEKHCSWYVKYIRAKLVATISCWRYE